MDPVEEIKTLKAEVERLTLALKEMTAALKLLTEKEERAAAFVARVESLLGPVDGD